MVSLLLLLSGLGLTMVLSASSVESYAQDGSAYSVFTRQVIFVLLGLCLFYVGMRVKVATLRRWSLPAFLGCVAMLVLVLVPGIGSMSNGARSWFVLGPVSLQPSEVAKIAIAVWGAHLLSIKRGQLHSLRHMLMPLLPAAAIVLVLIFLQPDLGTSISLAIVVLGLLWFAGAPVKLFLTLLALAGVVFVVVALTASYRLERITSFLDPGADPQGAGYQAMQARYSLAGGGLWGVGLGQSRGKWSYLPEAHNDFIFAILGEELGFVGAAAVLLLFGALAYTGLRIARRSIDPFLRLLTATVTLWLVGQAVINIGYVIGLLPVTGLTLPLVSSGGTSTAVTMFVFGLLANAARHEPPAVAALRTQGEGPLGRLLRLPAPEPYRARPSSRVVRTGEQARRARTAHPAPGGARPTAERAGPEGVAADRRTEPLRSAPRGQSRQPARGPRSRTPEPPRRPGTSRGTDTGRGGRR
ncbi:putative lipid II flippase FtsW [Rhodococcus sp. X156]|uniref:putative lipid II flippase FtsW n=1 Tax=Rhodococcus sp. X156 TaxID=2499145 RepID=UPI001F49FB11|nr:putative lipid II flippase FtsW [Rhodococcus sp. X156]